MKKSISESDNRILFTKFNLAFLSRAGVEPEDYLTQLEDIGFGTQLIDKSARYLRSLTKDLLVKDDPSWCADLYCVKRQY